MRVQLSTVNLRQLPSSSSQLMAYLNVVKLTNKCGGMLTFFVGTFCCPLLLVSRSHYPKPFYCRCWLKAEGVAMFSFSPQPLQWSTGGTVPASQGPLRPFRSLSKNVGFSFSHQQSACCLPLLCVLYVVNYIRVMFKGNVSHYSPRDLVTWSQN